MNRDDYIERATERRERVISMTRHGMTARQIAQELDMTTRTVRRHRVAAGIAYGWTKPFPDHIWATAEQMLEDGCSCPEVARTLGMSDDTVRAHFPSYRWTPIQKGEWAAFMKRANRQLGRATITNTQEKAA